MAQTPLEPGHRSTRGTPRWVKVFGIIALVLVLLFIISLLAGVRHGPGLHTPLGDPCGSTASPVSQHTASSSHGLPLTPRLRKFALTAHLTCSIGWIGAVMAYLALVIAAMTSQTSRTLQAVWIAMEVIGWYAIVPLALAALLTGLVMALGTPWGLFRHYWVLISLVLTILATVVLLVHMQTVSDIEAERLQRPVPLSRACRAKSSTPVSACWCCSSSRC